MVQLVRLLAAWAIALLIYAAATAAILGYRSPLAGELREGVLGIGLLVGLPALPFALLIVWPIAILLRGAAQPWTFIAGATALFSVAMLLLTAMLMPAGWRGASQALIVFAALLGLVWGMISVLTSRPPYSEGRL